MGMPDNFEKGPTHGDSATGYSVPYDVERRKERKKPSDIQSSPQPDDTGLKNPNGEFSDPASMVHPAASRTEPGPNGVGNSKCDGSIDPQGQQGGTHGGQSDGQSATDPLADAHARAERSKQRSAGGHSEGAFRSSESQHAVK